MYFTIFRLVWHSFALRVVLAYSIPDLAQFVIEAEVDSIMGLNQVEFDPIMGLNQGISP